MNSLHKWPVMQCFYVLTLSWSRTWPMNYNSSNNEIIVEPILMGFDPDANWPSNGPLPTSFNSLAPGRSECDSKNIIFNLVSLIGIVRSSHDNALWWMPQDLTDDKSTLVQLMAWCRQATSHYLGQCWLSSLSPYGVARPQWVNPLYSLIWVVVSLPQETANKQNPG